MADAPKSDDILTLLSEALEHSIHAPDCAYLHYEVDPKDVKKCNCWRGRAAKVLGKPTPPSTGAVR